MKSPAPAAGKQTVVGKNATHAKPTAAQHKMRVEAAKKAAVTRKHNLELAKKHHAAASKKHHPKPKRKLALNGDVACCAAEAVAASLRLAGHLVTDPDVYALYKTTAAGPDTGATIQETLEALMRHGLAGVRPLGFGPAAALEPGAVLGLTLTDAQRRQAVDLAARDQRLAAWFEAGRREREREAAASAPVKGRPGTATTACVETAAIACVPKKPRPRHAVGKKATGGARGKSS